MQSFKVITMGRPASTAEWVRAENAPESDLPPLTETQRRNAAAFHQSEHDYSRNLLLRRYAREREERAGRLLGERIAAVLKDLGPEYKLHTVARRGADSGWHTLIEHPLGVRDLQFGSDVESEVADLLSLRHRICRGLDRPDALQVAS